MLVRKEVYKESRNKHRKPLKPSKEIIFKRKYNSKQSETILFKCIEELLHESKVTALPTNV